VLPAVRRLLPFICSLVLVVMLAGCGGGTQSPAQKTRQAFLFAHPKLTDPQLAALCPSLYPSDFLSKGGVKKYNYKKDKKPFAPTAALKTQATQALGCTAVGTKPKK